MSALQYVEQTHYDLRTQNKEPEELLVEYSSLASEIPDKDPFTKAGLIRFRSFITNNFSVVPCMYIYELFADYFKKTERDTVFKQFLTEHEKKIDECRQMYLRLLIQENETSIQEVREMLEERITTLATRDSKKLTLPQLRQALTDLLLEHPQTMRWDEMYELYNSKRRPTVRQHTPVPNYRPKQDKYAFDLEAMKEQFADRSPWAQPGGKQFIRKKQRKFMKHFVDTPGTFVLDYMYAGKFVYLLAINVNTRKAYFAIPNEIRRNRYNWIVPKLEYGKLKVQNQSAIDSLKHIMEQTPVHHLIMDKEPAWTSKPFQQFLKDNNITCRFAHKNDFTGIIHTHETSRTNHTTTSLVDRLILTLRTMNDKLGREPEIPPDVLNYLIYEYNRRPHRTLSKIFRYKIAPNDVDDDYQKEYYVIQYLQAENRRIVSQPGYEPPKSVRVFNNAHYMDKVKAKLIPGDWTYVGREKGLFKVQRGEKTLLVNRWMLV